MALTNRQENESLSLKGVDLVADETEVPFGSFTQLSNWIPGTSSTGLALQKKRGVTQVDGIADPMAAIIYQDGFVRPDCPGVPGTCTGVGGGKLTITNDCWFMVCPCDSGAPNVVPAAMSMSGAGPGLCLLGLFQLTVTGGNAPISWASSMPEINMALSDVDEAGDQRRATLTWVNPGSAVSGTAYIMLCHTGVATPAIHRKRSNVMGCNDVLITCNCDLFCTPHNETCGGEAVVLACPGFSVTATIIPQCSDFADTCCGNIEGFACDKRTADMITLQCKPCRLLMSDGPAVITATDIRGAALTALIYS